VLYSVVVTCGQLGLDPFAYLRSAVPALSELGERPSDADLTAWLPDVWVTCRAAPAAPLAG
jgi:transposase